MNKCNFNISHQWPHSFISHLNKLKHFHWRKVAVVRNHWWSIDQTMVSIETQWNRSAGAKKFILQHISRISVPHTPKWTSINRAFIYFVNRKLHTFQFQTFVWNTQNQWIDVHDHCYVKQLQKWIYTCEKKHTTFSKEKTNKQQNGFKSLDLIQLIKFCICIKSNLWMEKRYDLNRICGCCELFCVIANFADFYGVCLLWM